jgi:SAM-dependent methyltransferase
MPVPRWLKNLFHRNISLRYFMIYSAPGWSDISTLNYGYAPASREVLDDPIGRNQPFQIELYRQVFLALGAPLSPGQRLCEVACGRGGGLAFIAGRTRAHCIGLEKSWPARRHARKRFGLDARQTVAPGLPLERESVDAFISVEAFHGYENDEFLREVARCLKPGGSIVIADCRVGRLAASRDRLAALFGRNGFKVAAFRDIMPNVLDALREDHDRKMARLRPFSGTFVSDELREMFACADSDKFRAFARGDWSYYLLTAVKNGQD